MLLKSISFLVVALMLAGAAYSQNIKIVSEQNSGEKLYIVVNDEFIVSLRNPGDGGYVFLPAIYDRSVLRLTTHKHLPADKHPAGYAGDFGLDEWKFKAIQRGTISKLTIQIQRPWMKAKEKPVTEFTAPVKIE
jgi:predicted secreted protein